MEFSPSSCHLPPLRSNYFKEIKLYCYDVQYASTYVSQITEQAEYTISHVCRKRKMKGEPYYSRQ